MAHTSRSAGSRPGTDETAGGLVESPLQLLCAVEAFAAGLVGPRLRLRVRSDVPSLGTALAQLDRLGLPDGIEPELVPGRAGLTAREPLQLTGDANSGIVQAWTLTHGFRRLVVVDDGLDTLELARVLTTPGQAVVRLRGSDGRVRRLLGRAVGHRLRRAARAGRVTIFTAMPLPADHRRALADLGVDLRTNIFSWLRSLPAPEAPPEPVVLVGSALVADGLVHPGLYVDWVRELAALGPVRYLPHRRQRGDVLAVLADVPGVVVDAPGAPVELRLRGLVAGQCVTMLPSTTAVLLTRILSPRGVRVRPRGVPANWWTPAAGPQLRTHLDQVVDLAERVRRADG
ncbi:hypothetical protein [Isoptericola haloaureus]|uniref:Uncharacterized protein n=1 Tax=Isoptericola haloaureus TaxID=1542902 RepID=A0ABU7Z512_9MICO